ncbi:MAG: DNA cytosine methyltransferase [Treponema sp.]
MTYLSICSGIEAASAAWQPLGFTPKGFAEIETFPCAVLQSHFPNVKNYGDITKYEQWNGMGTVDIVAGGTPCQSFSIAGKRGGLCDARGRLMYSYLGIVGKYKPRWCVWENVAGVLSSGGGADFAQLLSGLEKRGYGWAYRVLDAQYFGIPQRRRRVFVVGHIDDRTDLAAKVLFESESMRRNFTAGGKESQDLTSHAGSGVECTLYSAHPQNARYTKITAVADTVTARYGTGGNNTPLVVQQKADRAGWFIRWLTPLECERLQGFPDNWTKIAWRGKTAEHCPDSLRYKAIGNSMAVPVMKWIGERIKQIESRQKIYEKK